MTTACLTRLATPADAPALVRLNAAFNGTPETPEQLALRLENPRRVDTPLVAELDEHIVGFACLRLVPCVFYADPYAELTELYVEAAQRRRGVGRALLLQAEQLARAGGATRMYILTSPTNQAALALYQALGYQLDDLALYKQFPFKSEDTAP